MKKLAIMTMGAILAAGSATAQTAGAPETRDVNRTGRVERGAADMQTGSATTPGTGVDTTDQTAPQTAPGTEPAPEAERTAETDPFAAIEPADPDAAGTTGTTQPATPAQPAAPAQPGRQIQPADPQAGVQPADPSAQMGVQPADPSYQTGTADRTMPAVASNWLGMLLGGGLLSAAGFALRRRKK